MTQISFQIDDETKRQAEEVCADMGMSISTALCIYLKKLSRDRRIPFEISADPEPDPFYSDENMERLQRAVDGLNAGQGKVHEVRYD